MWIFTREGFFSVTDNKRDVTGNTVMVRARVKGDLAKLIVAIGSHPEIIETPKADYYYRAILTRREWAEYLTNTVMQLDYTNVKGTLAPTGERHTAMMRCWDAMGELQPGGPYGQRFRGGVLNGATLYDDVRGSTATPAKKVAKRTSKVVVSQGKAKKPGKKK